MFTGHPTRIECRLSLRGLTEGSPREHRESPHCEALPIKWKVFLLRTAFKWAKWLISRWIENKFCFNFCKSGNLIVVGAIWRFPNLKIRQLEPSIQTKRVFLLRNRRIWWKAVEDGRRNLKASEGIWKHLNEFERKLNALLSKFSGHSSALFSDPASDLSTLRATSN